MEYDGTGPPRGLPHRHARRHICICVGCATGSARRERGRVQSITHSLNQIIRVSGSLAVHVEHLAEEYMKCLQARPRARGDMHSRMRSCADANAQALDGNTGEYISRIEDEQLLVSLCDTAFAYARPPAAICISRMALAHAICGYPLLRAGTMSGPRRRPPRRAWRCSACSTPTTSATRRRIRFSTTRCARTCVLFMYVCVCSCMCARARVRVCGVGWGGLNTRLRAQALIARHGERAQYHPAMAGRGADAGACDPAARHPATFGGPPTATVAPVDLSGGLTARAKCVPPLG